MKDGDPIPTDPAAVRAFAAEVVDAIEAALMESADPRWGGWGQRQKFPHPDALHFLLVRGAASGRPEPVELAVHTLRSMVAAEIHDAVDGGFYRYATAPDWSVPDHEKPAQSNAKRLLALAEAVQVLGRGSEAAAALEEAAFGVASWMRTALLEPETGAFRATQDADPVHARLRTREERAGHGAPTVDATLFADRNGWAATGFLKAGFVFESGSLTETGLGALQFIVERLLDPERGVAHSLGGPENQRGELVDHATCLRAVVEAAHVGASNGFLGAGARVAEVADETLSREDGSFRSHRFQEAGEPGGADELRAAALMGESLVRFGVLSAEPRWVRRGGRALLALAGRWRPHGHAAAGLGRGLDLLARPPLHVTVVGPREDTRTRALSDAARRSYVSSRIAQTVDPASEPELAAAHGIDRDGPPRARLMRDGEELWLGSDPDALRAALGRLN